jgi:predicted kinase
VRFSIVPEQPYFSQEDRVFKEWIGRIIWCLESGYRYIYMDATHLSEKSRKKTFYYLNKYMKAKQLKCPIEAIYLDTSYEVCNERNASRTGREKVSVDSLKRMRNALTQPQLKEGFKKIYIIKEDKIEVEV